MLNVDELIDWVSQVITAKAAGSLYFKVLDLKYAYSQIRSTADSAKQGNFILLEDRKQEHIGFWQDFTGWLTCPLNSKSRWTEH